MKQLPRIASALYCEPWGILPAAHESLCLQFRAHCESGGSEITGRADATSPREPRGAADDPVGPCWRDEEGKIQSWHPQVEVRDTLAIMQIRGVIGKHLSTLAMWCGGCDSALIAQQAKNIANDPNITDVVVLVDSPGGSCVGAVEAAVAIRSMEEAGKTTYSYTDTTAASNGYFFAAACKEIWAAPSAVVGSISTFCAYLDDSRRWEMEGYERLVFRSGRLKGIGTSGKPFTDDEKAFLQQVTDQFSAQFKDFIRERRGLSDEDMQGQYWPAEFAPDGVVDGIANDLDELLLTIQAVRTLDRI